jgi:lipoate-protein ligase A
MEGGIAMAIDEALTRPDERGGCLPTARLYGFSPPALSIGRLQKIRECCDAEILRRDGVTLVRRPTGGQAVLHDDEITYSLVLSKEDAERFIGSFRKRAVYQFIAGMLLRGLEILGIRAMVNSAQRGDMRNPDCFGSTGEYEISTPDGKKLIGSAQMTTRTAVLQQGSIPITSPAGRVMKYLKGEESSDVGQVRSSCLSQEAGGPLSFLQAQEAFARAFREGFHAEEGSLTPREERAAQNLLAAKYATDAWNIMY